MNEAQKAKDKEGKSDKKKGKAAKSSKSDNKKSATPSQPAKDLGDLPPSVSDKLKQLYSAADTLRQKIATMEEEGKTSGLNMTRRLLETTEKQIATLEKQYES